MVEDYDRLIALYDISFFFRIYLRSCAQSLHDRVRGQDSLAAGRYMQFFETELITMPRMIYLFQSAYGSRFVRSVYQASYLTFIERQQQATKFLKKCVAEYDKFTFFRKTITTIEDNQLIEEPKVLNPRIKGKPHNRPLTHRDTPDELDTSLSAHLESLSLKLPTASPEQAGGSLGLELPKPAKLNRWDKALDDDLDNEHFVL